MHRCRKKSKKAGVTLVEVMVALFILGIGFSSLFSGFLASRKLAQGSIYQNTASTIAYSYLEQLKSVEFTALTPFESFDNTVLNADRVIPGIMSEGGLGTLRLSPQAANHDTGANTDVVNTYTIDINNTPAIETDDMSLRIVLYVEDATDLPNDISESRRIILRYEADFVAGGYTQTFSNVLRTFRSKVPTF